MVQVEVQEDAGDDRQIGEERENLHRAAATGTEKPKHAINASEAHGPADAGGVDGAGRTTCHGAAKK
jgi:hypothetical protein